MLSVLNDNNSKKIEIGEVNTATFPLSTPTETMTQGFIGSVSDCKYE